MGTGSFTGRARLGAILGGIAGVISALAFCEDVIVVIVLLLLTPTLALVGAACGAVTGERWWPSSFVLLSFAGGLVFWWLADWGVYVGSPVPGEEMVLKFELLPIEQFTISAVVGVLLGGILTGAGLVARRAFAVRRTPG